MSSTSFWRDKLGCPGFICLLLTLVTLLVFWPVGRHEFVNYDDPDYVTSNSQIQQGLTWTTFAWAMRSGHASNWHPLTWLSHALDWQLFGDRAGWHHRVNLGLHLANTALLFLVLRLMTGAHGRSALVAVLFALHPTHVESVAWVSERKDVLSTLFFLLTLGAYTYYVRALQGAAWPPTSSAGAAAGGSPTSGSNVASGRDQARPGQRSAAVQVSHRGAKNRSGGQADRLGLESVGQVGSEVSRGTRAGRTVSAPLAYGLTLVFFALGLMSKPMLVTLPFVLLLLDYWPLRRITLWTHPAAEQAAPGRGVREWAALLGRLVVEKLPFFALSAASCVVTFLVQQKGGAVSVSLSLGARLANALVSYARYIGKMFLPVNLSVLYPHPGTWPAVEVMACGALLLAISVGVLLLARARPYLPVGWLWFVGSLVPVIGLVQVGVQSMADRYTYVPLIGLFIVLIWGAVDLFPPTQRRWPALAVVTLLMVGSCAWLTSRQLMFWRDSEALFRHAVEVTEKNYLAYNNLGFYLSNHGRAAEAIEYYQRSIEINPAYEDALNNMGYALAGRKQYQAACSYYEAALRVRPNHPEVHNNLGNALSELGRIDEAISHYNVVLAQKPDHADAHNNLGIALAMQGKLAQAVPHFEQAIRFKPNYASAHSNLGNAYAVQRKFDEAIREYRESLRLKPDDAQAHNNLGNVLAEQGRVDEAVAQYSEALKLNADNPEAHCNLGMALLRQGKREPANEHFREALRLKPDYDAARKQLTAP